LAWYNADVKYPRLEHVMQAVVVGGSGVAGSYAVEALIEAGHTVRVVSRRTGVDVYTGKGLQQALTGVDVVIDALNSTSLRATAAKDFFRTTARNIRSAAEAERVAHIAVLSILGIDRVRGYGYYEAKLVQEQEMAAGSVPVTFLRATQFHEFPGQLLARLRLGPIAVIPHMRSQPVAARTVGRHLARLAEQRPGGVVELAGPQVHDVADLARRFVQARGDRVRVLAVRAPGRAARDMRAGALLATAATIVDGPAYDDWLRSPDARRGPAALAPVGSTQ
jgi:uncharacterized protein YbjT (DUF2867 family)